MSFRIYVHFCRPGRRFHSRPERMEQTVIGLWTSGRVPPSGSLFSSACFSPQSRCACGFASFHGQLLPGSEEQAAARVKSSQCMCCTSRAGPVRSFILTHALSVSLVQLSGRRRGRGSGSAVSHHRPYHFIMALGVGGGGRDASNVDVPKRGTKGRGRARITKINRIDSSGFRVPAAATRAPTVAHAAGKRTAGPRHAATCAPRKPPGARQQPSDSILQHRPHLLAVPSSGSNSTAPLFCHPSSSLRNRTRVHGTSTYSPYVSVLLPERGKRGNRRAWERKRTNQYGPRDQTGSTPRTESCL